MLNKAKLLSSGNVHIHLSLSWGEACKPAILCISLESQRASDSMPDRYSYALQQGTVFWELPGKLSSASNGNLLNLAEAFLGFNLFKLQKRNRKRAWKSEPARQLGVLHGVERCEVSNQAKSARSSSSLSFMNRESKHMSFVELKVC